MLGTFQENSRKIAQMIRVGTVKEVDQNLVRVIFGDEVSDWLSVIPNAAGTDKSFQTARKGEQVLCLFPGAGDYGFAIRGLFWDGCKLPDGAEEGVFIREFGDGTRLEYNEKTHSLDAAVKGSVTLKADGDISVTSTQKVTVKAVGIELDGGGGASMPVLHVGSLCPLGLAHTTPSKTVKVSQ